MVDSGIGVTPLSHPLTLKPPHPRGNNMATPRVAYPVVRTDVKQPSHPANLGGLSSTFPPFSEKLPAY